MQSSVILLLIGCAVLAALWYYIGFVRPPEGLAWLAQAGFVFFTFFLIPLLAGVLWLQAGATARLAETGIAPHPTIKEAVGVTMGVGEDPTWVFEVEAPPEAIATFYRTADNRPGWDLISGDPSIMILKRGNETMVIGAHQSWTSRTLTYMLTRADQQPTGSPQRTSKRP